MVGGNVAGGYFNSTTEAPFIGTYGVATYGSFYVDGLLRYDYFQTQLNSPTVNLFNQSVDAHGFTFSASTGYNYKVPNSSWFVEPSLGVVWSREQIDPFNAASPITSPGGFLPGNFSGSTQVNDISSVLGRAGVRFGTTLQSGDIVFQPFFAASVWHDFGSNITSTYSACNNCIFTGGVPAALAASTSTNNIGTFGQYSVGVAGQLTGTGWLGFARADFREGPNMSGLSGTGGIRYQFTPDSAPSAMPVKAPPAPALINWAGLYAGAIGGAEAGHGSMYFPTSMEYPRRGVFNRERAVRDPTCGRPEPLAAAPWVTTGSLDAGSTVLRLMAPGPELKARRSASRSTRRLLLAFRSTTRCSRRRATTTSTGRPPSRVGLAMF